MLPTVTIIGSSANRRAAAVHPFVTAESLALQWKTFSGFARPLSRCLPLGVQGRSGIQRHRWRAAAPAAGRESGAGRRPSGTFRAVRLWWSIFAHPVGDAVIEDARRLVAGVAESGRNMAMPAETLPQAGWNLRSILEFGGFAEVVRHGRMPARRQLNTSGRRAGLNRAGGGEMRFR